MKESLISRSRRCLCGGGLVLLPLAVQAQAPAPPGPMPRVEITGTRIPRATSETASAVIALNRDDIERSGKTTVAELRTPSFTTVDLTFRWKPAARIDVFGSAQNIFDQLAPLDPLTYGATAYHPLDHAGAVGRFFTAGVRYTF